MGEVIIPSKGAMLLFEEIQYVLQVLPAVKTLSSSMSLDEPSAINDFSRVFIISLEPQIS